MTIKRGLVRDAEGTRQRIFLAMVKAAGLPQPHREYQFDSSRRFRADYCWPQHGIILEQEGGIWTRGAHGRGTGISRDIEKYNLAATLGYRVVRCVPKDLCTPETILMLTILLSELAA